MAEIDVCTDIETDGPNTMLAEWFDDLPHTDVAKGRDALFCNMLAVRTRGDQHS